jgi:hypothetical protein
MGRKIYSHWVSASILRQMANDKNAGMLLPAPADLALHFEKAMDLSRRFTPIYLCRSLDVLHVAGACVVATTEFASFDARQRELVARAMLKLLPRSLP